MKRTSLALVSALVLAAPTAHAADMALKAPPPPAPVFSWTGCYIGVNGGAAWNHSNVVSTMDPGSHFGLPANLAAVDAAGTGSMNKTGFIGGGQAGCNFQTGAFVFGLEGDIDGVSANATLTGTGVSTIGPFAVTNSVKTNWLATVRPRAGVAFDRSLLYVTGGAAFAGIRYTQAYADTTPEFASGASQASQTKTGYAVGVGWEYAFMGNWSAKAEYLYVRFPSISTTTFVADTPGLGTGTNTLHGTASLQSNIFRLGLNYRFGAPM